MTINEPNRKAVCFHCDVDIKYSLAQLAKYHKTTITNLLEEGAKLIISQQLKHIRNTQLNTDHLHNNLESSLNW